MVRPTAGSVENLALLQDAKSGVHVAFVQGGIGSPRSHPGLAALGSLYYEPLWLFTRLRALEDLRPLVGARIAVGPEGSGTRAVALRLLAENGLDKDNVRLMPRTTVTGAYDGGMFGALERVNQHRARRGEGAPLECFWRIAAKQSILAAGALERPVAFANNDRPGIMTAGAVRAYLNRWGVAPGKQVAVFGNNDDAHRTARDLAAAGVHVAALIDSREGVSIEGADLCRKPAYCAWELAGSRP